MKKKTVLPQCTKDDIARSTVWKLKKRIFHFNISLVRLSTIANKLISNEFRLVLQLDLGKIFTINILEFEHNKRMICLH